MGEQPTAYPLAWPEGWPRTDARDRGWSRFVSRTEKGTKAITLAAARGRLQDELDRLGADVLALSTNMPIRLDGVPRSDAREPDDPGAALYFVWRGRRIVLACDRWNTVASNVAALAAHIEALRGQERWGVGTLEQAFSGYTALPAATAGQRPWRVVLGFAPQGVVTLDMAAAYRSLAREAHPDAPGGSHEKMAALNVAIAEARKELGCA